MDAFRKGDIAELSQFIGKNNTVVLACAYKADWETTSESLLLSRVVSACRRGYAAIEMLEHVLRAQFENFIYLLSAELQLGSLFL